MKTFWIVAIVNEFGLPMASDRIETREKAEKLMRVTRRGGGRHVRVVECHEEEK